MTDALAQPELAALLEDLHGRSESQVAGIDEYFRARAAAGDLSWDGMDEKSHAFFADKLVALDRDKARFCHLLCMAIGARRVVEVGTSLGVSTLYLAAAVKATGGGVVIGTEHEEAKAVAARATFAKAGLADLIDLRVGDLRETLKDLEGPIDFVLVDIWVETALPALKLIAPHLRKGSVVVADNTAAVRGPYRDYFAFLADSANGFSTMTLPFAGGLEMTVRVG
jgi:predicted O-methyltransferase YrrM